VVRATIVFAILFDLDDPAVKAKMRERYGTRVLLDEPVISPAAIYDSHLLQTISD